MILGELSVSVVSPDGPPPDSNLLQVEWWAIPAVGTPFVLHEVTDFDVADIAGSRGVVSVTVPIGTATHDLLYANTVSVDTDCEVEIRLFGGQARSLRGYLQEADGDDVAETGSRKWSGCLTAGRMYESVLPPNPDDPKGEWHFAGKNAGQIVLTLMQQAKARSELTDITTATFNTANDSLGNGWEAATTITLSPGSLLGELLEEFEDLGLCEWDVSAGKELRLYVPGQRGVDRTALVPPVVLHRGRDLLDANRKWSVRNSLTDLLASGKEGLYQTASNASALARRGRKVVGYASAGQVDNTAALQAYAQNKLLSQVAGTTELSHGLVVNGPGPRPFIDVNLGDWVWSDTGTPAGPQRLRVQQVSVSRSGDETKAIAVVGTLSQSAVVTLNRRLARMERGSTVVGTSVDPTAPGGGEDVTPPAAPTGLVASSIAYQDVESGETLARIDLGWQAVTTDARDDISPQAQAAQLILDRIEQGTPILADWTWTGAPALVGVHNDTLLAAYAADGNTDPTNLTVARSWLQNYILVAEQAVSDPVVTDDVAGYRVRYAYVGLNQIGGIPSSDPFLDEDTLAYSMATGDTGTTATTYSWGGVGAGREVRLQVQAFDRSGNSSVWSAPLVITTAADNLPPQVTSTPVVTPYFGAVKVTWDGLTSLGVDARTADPDFAYVEVHLGQALDFTPSLATFQTRLATAGTWPVNDLEYGAGYYARLVAVDTGGNASAPSVTAGPAVVGKLVNIDFGPESVDRASIRAAAIGSAQIDVGAVNELHVASVNAGAIRTGTLIADVTLSGIIRTALTGARAELDAAGLRLYNTAGLVTVNLDAFTGTALLTGGFQTGLSGERVKGETDGTLRFYPIAGTNYSQIANFGNDVVWRGPLDPNGRSGRFNVNVLGCGLNFSAESEIPTNLRAEVAVFDRYARTTAPNIEFRVDGKLSVPDGSRRRVLFYQTNASGANITSSFVYYRMAGNSTGGWFGNNCGIKFEGLVKVTEGEDMTAFGDIQASGFLLPSSLAVKTDVTPLRDRLGSRPVDVVQAVQPIMFRYRNGQKQHVGFAVEHLAPHAPQLIVGLDRPADEQALDGMGVAAVAWAAAADNASDIADLRARVEALEALAAA